MHKNNGCFAFALAKPLVGVCLFAWHRFDKRDLLPTHFSLSQSVFLFPSDFSSHVLSTCVLFFCSSLIAPQPNQTHKKQHTRIVCQLSGKKFYYHWGIICCWVSLKFQRFVGSHFIDFACQSFYAIIVRVLSFFQWINIISWILNTFDFINFILFSMANKNYALGLQTFWPSF